MRVSGSLLDQNTKFFWNKVYRKKNRVKEIMLGIFLLRKGSISIYILLVGYF
jgi:hypothetical protein